MYPELFHIGPLTLHTYGFFLAVGFVFGMAIVVKEARRLGMDHEKVMDLCLFALLAAVVASRIPYVLFNWDQFRGHPLEMFMLWRGGLVFYGGFLGAALVVVIYVKKYDLPFWRLSDLFGLGTPIGYAFGRLGCFSAGCCYGKPCGLPWAVTFDNPLGLAPPGVPRHPAQLNASAGSLLIFFFLYFFLRKRKRFDGQIFLTYVALYALFRFCIEFVRGDDRGAFFLGILSPSQTLALILGPVALVFLFFLSRRAAGKPPNRT